MLLNMYKFLCFVLLLFFATVHCKNELYDGQSLYEVFVNDVDQTQLLSSIEHSYDVDIWSHAVPSRPGKILVPKEIKTKFEDLLNKNGIRYTVAVENIKELIDLEEQQLKSSLKSTNVSRTGLPLTTIYTYEQVDAYLEDLARAYPNVVTLVNAGKSFEGRDIKYLKISTTNFQDTSKPIVYIESLLHAREWVTLPATLYAIQKLVIDVTEQDLLQDIDWIILPIANPDGFHHTHTDGRFWRKNRATGYTINNICMGVDLNRNFDVFWSQASSNLACTDTFHGRSPFSEPETVIIRNILLEHLDRIELFLDIHSFGSMILYGYGTGELPANALIVHLAGVQMAQAIDTVKMSFNPDYVVGNVALVLYESSGSAGDYAQSIGIPLAYTYELPGLGFGIGAFGFLVDPNFIEQAGFETWEGIKFGARFARNTYRARKNLI